ncbi:hypothetical protein HAX54_010146, partial [Datura stramonium]|nr:hypothetical protein [Datura stramonium]
CNTSVLPVLIREEQVKHNQGSVLKPCIPTYISTGISPGLIGGSLVNAIQYTGSRLRQTDISRNASRVSPVTCQIPALFYPLLFLLYDRAATRTRAPSCH